MAKPKAKILIIDDESAFVEATGKRLEASGYEALMALSGEEGIKIAREESPNLILLDILMPKMDGLEVTKKLKADPQTSSVPIIILTALGEKREIVASSLVDGAVDYIAKPFDAKLLLEKIRKELSP